MQKAKERYKVIKKARDQRKELDKGIYDDYKEFKVQKEKRPRNVHSVNRRFFRTQGPQRMRSAKAAMERTESGGIYYQYFHD